MFWIPKLWRFPFFFSAPGNCASAVAQYSRKSAFCRPLRANSVRSYALETWSGASYPSGDTTVVSSACNSSACACMSATVFGTPPYIADSTCTASLPERRNTPSHRSWTV